jgi:hypothetical protein
MLFPELNVRIIEKTSVSSRVRVERVGPAPPFLKTVDITTPSLNIYRDSAEYYY